MNTVAPQHSDSIDAVGPRWLDAVFLVGLAGVFVVNAIVAVVHPDDFAGLIERSAFCRWLHLERLHWLTPAIALNDLLLGLTVLGAARFPRWRPFVLAWTGAWLLAVTLVKLSALGS
jgi:hypothetical protein